MAMPAGVQRWLPYFAHLGGLINAPDGGGASLAQYLAHVQGLRSNVFADQINLQQVAEAFAVDLQVIPKTPSGAPREWAITTITSPGSTRTILLGNDDLHYVWLRPRQA